MPGVFATVATIRDKEDTLPARRHTRQETFIMLMLLSCLVCVFATLFLDLDLRGHESALGTEMPTALLGEPLPEG